MSVDYVVVAFNYYKAKNALALEEITGPVAPAVTD